MKILDLSASPPGDATFHPAILHQGETATIRRIALGKGAVIPPCPMQDDAVFVVLSGAVRFRAEGEEALVRAPGAVWIPASAATRGMEAEASSVVLAVLCRTPTGSAP